MSQSENKMEMISKGSYEPDNIPSSSSSQLHRVLSETHSSLEYLPPEAPYFILSDDGVSTRERDNIITNPLTNDMEDELALIRAREDLTDQLGDLGGGGEDAERLYERIHQLSAKIQSEMGGTKHNTGWEEAIGVGGERGAVCNNKGMSMDVYSSEEKKKSREWNRDKSNTTTRGVVEHSRGMADVFITRNLNKKGKEISNHTESPLTDSKDINRETKKTSDSRTANDCVPDPHTPCSSQSSIGIEDPEAVQFEDPKTQKAYEKMLKLDEKLAEASRKEAAVKKQRKLLEKDMERKGISWPASNMLKPVEEFLPPVFPTQPTEMGTEQDNVLSIREEGKTLELSESEEEEEEEGERNKTKSVDDGTNFIKRNIELVADAGALVMMTKVEKERLQELLSEEDNMEVLDCSESNALCVTLTNATPFACDPKDLDRLREIDNRLQAILPATEWESINSHYDDNNTKSILSPSSPRAKSAEAVVGVSSDTPDLGISLEGESDLIVPPEVDCAGIRGIHYDERYRLELIDEKLRLLQEDDLKEIQKQVELVDMCC